MYSVNHWLLRLISGESDFASPSPDSPWLCWLGEPGGCSSVRGSARPTKRPSPESRRKLRERFDEAAATLGEIADRANGTGRLDPGGAARSSGGRPAVRRARRLVARRPLPQHRPHRLRASRRHPARVGGTGLGPAPGPHRGAVSPVRGAPRTADSGRAAHRSRAHGPRPDRDHCRRAGVRGRRLATDRLASLDRATTRSFSKPHSCPSRCVRALRMSSTRSPYSFLIPAANGQVLLEAEVTTGGSRGGARTLACALRGPWSGPSSAGTLLLGLRRADGRQAARARTAPSRGGDRRRVAAARRRRGPSPGWRRRRSPTRDSLELLLTALAARLCRVAAGRSRRAAPPRQASSDAGRRGARGRSC